MKNQDESPRFLGIWLAGRVGHSLTKTGHPKETHNKNIWGKFSKYLHNKVWNAKKNARSLYVQQKCPTESFKKSLKCMIAPDKICMLKVQRSEKHNFDINRCRAAKPKKHITANWAAAPGTLTGQSGNLREHGALVGQEHFETGWCFGKSPNIFMCSQRPQPTASRQVWAPVGQKLKLDVVNFYSATFYQCACLYGCEPF